MTATKSTFNPEEVLKKLTVAEKISLLTGIDFWHTKALPEHGVPSIRMSDGSSGIRGTQWCEGARGALLPCGTGLASTWDRSLVYEAGTLIGREAIAKGANVWLGPTINIQRGPLGGRGGESWSEDPYLTGALSSEIVKGCQSHGIISTIKHFVCNEQEEDKISINVIVTDRALREIHLRPFQLVARDASPRALMSSYNKVNGEHCSESKFFLDELVRGEWGQDPLIMCDWLGLYTTAKAVNNGLDLEMPGPSVVRGQALATAVASGLVKMSTLDKRALRVLKFVEECSRVKVSETEAEIDCPENRALNRKLACNSIVMLKNDGNILPIPSTIKKIALIGSHMKDADVAATGSTGLETYYTRHPFDSIKERVGPDVEVRYAIGATTHRLLPVLDSRKTASNITFNLFNEPYGTKNRESVGLINMRKSYFTFMDYLNPKIKSDTFYGTVETEFKPDTTGTWKFGLCVSGTADLYLDEELIINNSEVQKPGHSFFNMGTQEEYCLKKLEAGRIYKVRVEFGSAPTSKLPSAAFTFGGGGFRVGACLDFTPEEARQQAVEAAKDADYAVICTGLSGEWEGECLDRTHMDLPPNVDKMIAEIAAVCPKTIVVNRSGMPVHMPWVKQVPGIFQAWYGGNESGSSIADVLFGDHNPSGKMPISWPERIEDNPAYLHVGSSRGRLLFGEDIYVGYRWYDKMRNKPLWEFGYGLSYTTFSFSEPTIKPDYHSTARRCYEPHPHTHTVTVKVKNTGDFGGAEILQLYVSGPESSAAHRPMRELHGFGKVFLQPDEEKDVPITLDAYAFSFWDEIENNWCEEKGKYIITVSAGSGSETKTCEVTKEETFHWRGL